ncbi:MAG: NADH-quinone oxidoreductase subunit NuoB [Oligoflexia bacterium]|nr:NADH-quinone oxidoreductase subunit NuoB [Oligoflexia bacterium]
MSKVTLERTLEHTFERIGKLVNERLSKLLFNRFEQGYRTTKYPDHLIHIPSPYRGRPEINFECDYSIMNLCAQNCPQQALLISEERKGMDLGKCVFCGECERLSEEKFIHFTTDFSLATARHEELFLCDENPLPKIEKEINEKIRKLFGRSLQLRQVSAGGCNACEQDINVLNTPFFDLSRLGIQIVASPRHADGIMVTGPVTKNMQQALMKTYKAIPDPKIVIAVGSCAISGGPFYQSSEVVAGVENILPVDLFIPGCPPHPLTTLKALIDYFKVTL